MKIKATDDLIEKAAKLFQTKSIILTGQGLTRQELRALERGGIIKKQPARLKGSGSIRIAWQINPSFGNIDGKRIEVLKRG